MPTYAEAAMLLDISASSNSPNILGVDMSKNVREGINYSVKDDIIFNLKSACECVISLDIPEHAVFFNNGIYESLSFENHQVQRHSFIDDKVKCPRTNEMINADDLSTSKNMEDMIDFIKNRSGYSISNDQSIMIMNDLFTPIEIDTGIFDANTCVTKITMMSIESARRRRAYENALPVVNK